MSSPHAEARLDRKFVEFAKLMNTYLQHFPRSEKYALALQIRNAAYDVYGLIVECQKRYHKKTTLTSLDIRHEQLRMLVRLAHELGYFAFRDGEMLLSGQEKAVHRYATLSAHIDELGRMIQGWKNYIDAQEATKEEKKKSQPSAVREVS